MDKEKTNWSDVANEFVNTWSETGTKMWQSWFELVGSIPSGQPLSDSKAELNKFTERVAENQDVYVRFLKLSVDAWKDIFPQVESGGNWQKTLNQYAEQMRDQLASFSEGSLNANKDIAELWQLYIREMQKFSQLWFDPLGLSLNTMGKAVTGNPSASIELNNLYWNLLYEESFGSLMKSPVLGPTREFNGKLVSGFDAWTELYKASINYQFVLADIQVRSFEVLMQELVSLAEKGEKVEDWRQFQLLWSQVSDGVFEEAFCRDDNLKIRGKFLNALNTYRIQQQELMELSLKTMNVPLRSEVDEIHKSIYELRKEVKQLKKALAKSESREQPEL
jgi:class III poly(R)-hydroxyalkanoic acid synthase PhaE subunit